uniref:Structural capsid n=1 Tax=Latid herpesvirus 1 TaxID=3096545 RepID=A0AB33V6X0_9VIRU
MINPVSSLLIELKIRLCTNCFPIPMMFSTVGTSSNKCFDETPSPGRLLVKLCPLDNPENDQILELVNSNLLRGSEQMLAMMYRRGIDLSHMYVTLRDLVRKWGHFRKAFYRDVGLRVRQRAAPLSRDALVRILLEISQGGAGGGGTGPEHVRSPEVVWYFAQFILGNLNNFIDAFKFGGACTAEVAQGRLRQITAALNIHCDFGELLGPSDSRYIEETTKRADGSVSGKMIFVVARYAQNPPAVLENFPGLDLQVVLTDASIQQLSRQIAATVGYGHFTQFAICPVGKLITQSLLVPVDGDWRMFDAVYFKDVLGGAAEGQVRARPAPVKRIRFLVV